MNQFRFNGYAFLSLYNTIFVNDPKFYKPFSFVQFQRSATENHYKIFNHYIQNIRKQVRAPLIYEIDDMLFNIPKWNYASDYYAPTEDIIKKMMSLCDGMTVSTEALKEAYSPYCKKITVIPNHLPKFLWGESIVKDKPRELKDRPRIGWMGSENHFVHPATKQYKEGIRGGDFGKKLLEFIRKTVDVYQWVLSGAKPVELVDLIDTKKIEFHSWKSILEYPTHARALDLDIGIAPLYPSNFNDCKCLVGSTKVISETGIVTIDNLSIGDNVWQKDSFKEIKNIISYKNKNTLKIKTARGFEIEGTLNHKLSSNGKFIKMSDLKVGDDLDLNFFEFPNNQYQTITAPFFLTKKLNSIDFNKMDETLMPKLTINEDWGRFIGYVMGDGHISHSNSISISCSIDHKDFIEDVNTFCQKICLKPKMCMSKMGKGLNITISSRNLKYLISNKIGIGGCGDKKNLYVPDIIFKSPKSVIREFIRGLFETNGTVAFRSNTDYSSNCSFTTKSKQLAKDVQFLLLGFGIISTLSTRYNKLLGKNYYSVILYRHACDVFYDKINFISKNKKEKLHNIIIKKHSNAYKKMILSEKIVEIIPNTSNVYDIEIDGHYYTANGIISHNSNIKCLEFSHLGLAGVYSSARPYLDMSLNTNDEDEFVSNIEKVASDVDYRLQIHKQDYNTVEDQLYWESKEKLNLKRYINSYLEMFGKTLKM